MQKFLSLALLTLFLVSCGKKEEKILVFTRTQTFRHSSIEAGVEAIFKLGKENGIKIDTTSDSGKFTEENLKEYSTLLFLQSTGEFFDPNKKKPGSHLTFNSPF